MKLNCALFLTVCFLTIPNVNGQPPSYMLIEKDNGDSWITFHDPGEYWYSMGIDRSNLGAFSLNVGGSLNSSQFVMLNNGNLGIGTNQPDIKLNIAGSDEDNIHLGINGTNGRLAFLGDAGGGSDGQLGLYSSSGGIISVLLNGTGNSYVNTTGNFGIGTNQPDVKLNIAGSDEDNIHVGINGTNGRLAFLGDAGGGSDGQLGLYSSSGGNIAVLLNGVGNSYINSSGSFGIGTDQPDSKLTVNGDIHTKEVKVDLDGALAPDFVFEEEYNLRSLEETENYIQKHKHLPEIPSASEMDEKGIELKEMNLKLLQKVEELTLYLIEQNKEIKKLKKLTQKQQTDIEVLKSK